MAVAVQTAFGGGLRSASRDNLFEEYRSNSWGLCALVDSLASRRYRWCRRIQAVQKAFQIRQYKPVTCMPALPGLVQNAPAYERGQITRCA